MTIKTLTITNVDITLLEAQRNTLSYITNNPNLFPHLSTRQREDVAAISNMLNEWSDQRYHKERLNEKV